MGDGDGANSICKLGLTLILTGKNFLDLFCLNLTTSTDYGRHIGRGLPGQDSVQKNVSHLVNVNSIIVVS